jgi:hypothetical protein
MRAFLSAESHCCPTPPSSHLFRCRLTSLCTGVCRFQASGFPGQFTSHQYVVGILSSRQIGHTGCFSRPSPISDGNEPAAAEACEAQSHARGCAARIVSGRCRGGGRRGGGGLRSLALLRLHRRQRLADLLVTRCQVGLLLLLPQLGEQLSKAIRRGVYFKVDLSAFIGVPVWRVRL